MLFFYIVFFNMTRFAVLCGAAPDGFRQKKLEKTYESLVSGSDAVPPQNIIVFPNGVQELFLEGVLSRFCDDEPDEILLHFFALSEADLNALSDYEAVGYGRIPLVRLGDEEIRKEVIAYYEGLAEKLGIALRADYSVDADFVSEEELGYEKIS